MWAAIKDTLDHTGWLANAITFVVFAGTLILYIYNKYRSKMSTPRTFQALVSNREHHTNLVDLVRDIGEIAIVDDEPADFPIVELREAGYKIKSYKRVSLSDFRALARYDLVFLDMHGIVKDDVQEGGLKLIVKLRNESPVQKICAVSSKTFDPTASEFFKQADDVKKKPINAQQCLDVINDLLGEKFTVDTIASRLDKKFDTKVPGEKLEWLKSFILATKSSGALSVPAFPAALANDKEVGVWACDLLKVLRHEHH